MMRDIIAASSRRRWPEPHEYPKDLRAPGYSMLLYPTIVILRVTLAIQKAVEDLRRVAPCAQTTPSRLNSMSRCHGYPNGRMRNTHSSACRTSKSVDGRRGAGHSRRSSNSERLWVSELVLSSSAVRGSNISISWRWSAAKLPLP